MQPNARSSSGRYVIPPLARTGCEWTALITLQGATDLLTEWIDSARAQIIARAVILYVFFFFFFFFTNVV